MFTKEEWVEIKKNAVKVIHLGFPMKMNFEHPNGPILFGFWSWVPAAIPIDPIMKGGWIFIQYEGSYWRALWRWLTID